MLNEIKQKNESPKIYSTTLKLINKWSKNPDFNGLMFSQIQELLFTFSHTNPESRFDLYDSYPTIDSFFERENAWDSETKKEKRGYACSNLYDYGDKKGILNKFFEKNGRKYYPGFNFENKMLEPFKN